MRNKLTKEEWVSKAIEQHGNKFDYSKVEYINSKSKVIIICPIHGEFSQVANSHLNGTGCSKCSDKYKYSTEEWIIKANIVHDNKYSYEKTKYINAYTKVIITCPLHGDFEQKPENHVNLKNGCPLCNCSKGELLINSWLKENNIPFKTQFELITSEIARDSNLIVIDFFVKYNEKQYFIEYDGIQHFEYNSYFHKGNIDNFCKQQRRDKVLNKFCELHKDKDTLLRFDYKQSDLEIIKMLNKNVKESQKL